MHKVANDGGIVGSLSGTALSVALGLPVATGIMLAIARRQVTGYNPMDAKLTQQNLHLAEVKRNIAAATKQRKLGERSEKEMANARTTGNTLRELHI